VLKAPGALSGRFQRLKLTCKDHVESAWFQRLKLKYYKPVSDFAFKFNLRRYIVAVSQLLSCGCCDYVVCYAGGRCSLDDVEKGSAGGLVRCVMLVVVIHCMMLRRKVPGGFGAHCLQCVRVCVISVECIAEVLSRNI